MFQTKARVLILFFVTVATCSLAPCQVPEVLLFDDFNRPNAFVLGPPWIEAFEGDTGTEVGVIELDAGTLTYRFRTSTGNYNTPLTFAPLAKTITGFPATFSLRYRPHENERSDIKIGIMSAAGGFNCSALGYCIPADGFFIGLNRSGFGFPFSTIGFSKVESSLRTDLAHEDVFTMIFGRTYLFTVTIQADLSTTIEVVEIETNNRDVFQFPQTCMDFAFNQFFISDTGSLSMFGNFEAGKDYRLQFDDVLVTQTAGGQRKEFCGQVRVPVDIKPGSCPNALNVKAKGVVPVAILGTADFDVTEIDVATLQLGGVDAIQYSLEDVATPFEPYVGKQFALDCNERGSDGYLDLTLKFDTEEIAEAIENAVGPLQDGAEIALTLTGQFLDGQPFVGEDVVLIRKKGK